jgi:hypothetical protein
VHEILIQYILHILYILYIQYTQNIQYIQYALYILYIMHLQYIQYIWYILYILAILYILYTLYILYIKLVPMEDVSTFFSVYIPYPLWVKLRLVVGGVLCALSSLQAMLPGSVKKLHMKPLKPKPKWGGGGGGGGGGEDGGSRMQLDVLFITGTTITLDVWDNDTIDNVKAKIHDKEPWLPVSQQSLVFDCEQLEDGRTLLSYSIKNNDTVHVSYPNDFTPQSTSVHAAAADPFLRQHGQYYK